MGLGSPLRAVLTFWMVFVVFPLGSWAQAKALSLQQIVSGMEQAQSNSPDRLVAYTVTREYELGKAGAQTLDSQVIAEVDVVPPSVRDYSIVQSEGSSRGESVVRKILDHETQMASRPELHEISTRNYDFALQGRELIGGHDCYVLQLSPKRQAVELIRGKLWVDANNLTIHRIEGSPAKSPSWWIKGLTVTLNYGAVSGLWVQTSTKAVADVRFSGTHVLTSRNLDVRLSSLNAQNQLPAQHPARRSGAARAVGNTATWVPR